jgi:hypothetical protein
LDAEPEPGYLDDFYLDDDLAYLGAGLEDHPYPFPE